MERLVTLDDGMIVQLAYDSQLSAQIPCLTNKRDLFRVGGACGACAKRKQGKQLEELVKIKRCLAAMSDDHKHALKKYLKADKVRLFYANVEKKVVQLTF
jgi:hypothetical protein